MKLLVVALLSLCAVALLMPRSVSADTPENDLQAANAIVQRALQAAQNADIATATAQYRAFENRWFEIEDPIRDKSKDSYRTIEKYMVQVDQALTASKPDKDTIVKALTALAAENKRFIAGQPASDTSTATTSNASQQIGDATVTTLLGLLATTKQQAQSGDFAAANKTWSQFGDTWLDVEGEIKTRSAGDYRDTENDMARVATALGKKDAGVVTMLDGMTARLKPYENAGDYKPYDATIIVIREGLEALLVVVALLAFLQRSGNADKSRYIWGGAGVGLVASIALGIAIHELLGKAFSGENRELMEGITGILAAVMLLYVSYWLHSKSSIGAWQKYIGHQTTQALATGSLIGLGLLSFLAVFREGGETVLFFLGMTGRISTGDMLLGLAIGAVFPTIVGVLLIVVGVRIPMRPFFAVASVLTFYLCFKFVGTGLHSLQVADVLNATTEDYLPSNDTLGLFPSWQTTIPQVILLAVGLGAAAYSQLRDRVHKGEPAKLATVPD